MSANMTRDELAFVGNVNVRRGDPIASTLYRAIVKTPWAEARLTVMWLNPRKRRPQTSLKLDSVDCPRLRQEKKRADDGTNLASLASLVNGS
jgi:hypothetical protein